VATRELLKKPLLKLDRKVAENLAWSEEQIQVWTSRLAYFTVGIWIPIAPVKEG
jgi:hypothetical protein